MSVYRVFVRARNKSEEANLEAFIRAENAGEAVAKLLKDRPGLTEFGSIAIDEVPNGIIIE